MNTCPCCSDVLLRHARHSGIYWFCPHCWQEMPDPSLSSKNSRQTIPSIAMPQLPEFTRALAVR